MAQRILMIMALLALAVSVSAQNVSGIAVPKKNPPAKTKAKPVGSESSRSAQRSGQSHQINSIGYNTPIGVRITDDLLMGAGAQKQLTALADFVKNNGDDVDYVYVIGFSTWSGGGAEDFKTKLSIRRAEWAKKKLVSYGVDENMIFHDGKLGICDVDGVVFIVLDKTAKDDQFWTDITNALSKLSWK